MHQSQAGYQADVVALEKFFIYSEWKKNNIDQSKTKIDNNIYYRVNILQTRTKKPPLRRTDS